MASTPSPSLQTAAPVQGPVAARPAQDKRKPVAAKPAKDRLTVSTAARVQAQPQQQQQSPVANNPVNSKTNLGVNVRVGGLFTFFSTALTSWVFDPRLLVNHVKTIFGQVYRVASGTKQVHALAKGYKAARAEGTQKTFLQDAAKQAKGWAKNGIEEARDKVLRAFGNKASADVAAKAAKAAAPVATLERNRGLFGWFRAARAEGASPLKALGLGIKRTIETGGDMPQVVAHAEGLGTWGKAFIITGRVARLAPLLNVPIAALDLIHLRQVLHAPDVSPRLRNAKIGQAVLSTTAAGLSIAAFLVPAPLDLAALRFASYAGFASLGWSILSSRPVVNFGKRVLNALHIGPHQELEPAPTN